MADKRPNRKLGGPHSEFWDYCAKGELRLQRCEACGTLQWPVTDVCEHCDGTSFDWQRMSGSGKVISWCSFHQDYYAGTFPLPWDVLLVELAEGPLFVGNPQGFGLDAATMDMPVTVAFAACEDDAGAFSLPVFERA